jgi:hypothetical protein
MNKKTPVLPLESWWREKTSERERERGMCEAIGGLHVK